MTLCHILAEWRGWVNRLSLSLCLSLLCLCLSLSLSLSRAVIYSPSIEQWLLIVDGDFLLLNCQQPGNIFPTDHRDNQMFRMDCDIAYMWIFQTQREHTEKVDKQTIW